MTEQKHSPDWILFFAGAATIYISCCLLLSPVGNYGTQLGLCLLSVVCLVSAQLYSSANLGTIKWTQEESLDAI